MSENEFLPLRPAIAFLPLHPIIAEDWRSIDTVIGKEMRCIQSRRYATIDEARDANYGRAATVRVVYKLVDIFDLSVPTPTGGSTMQELPEATPAPTAGSERPGPINVREQEADDNQRPQWLHSPAN